MPTNTANPTPPTPPAVIHSKLASFLTTHSLLTTQLVSLSYQLIIKHFNYSLLLLSLTTSYYYHHHYSPAILIYSALETIFYILFLRRRNSLVKSNPSILPPPKPSPELRKKILRGILTSCPSTYHLRECLSGWFYHTNNTLPSKVDLDSIHAENIQELLAGIFFASPLNELNEHNSNEIRDDLRDIEEQIEYTFKPGKNHTIKPMNHTLDPVRIEHRPLLFYLLIESFRSFVSLIFRLVGFRKFYINIHHSFSFNYWFHPGLSPCSDKPPIILIAGIVGLISIPHYAIYLLFTSNRPIFLVGNSSVSLTLMKPDFELIKVKKKNATASEKTKTYMRRKILTLNEQSKCILKMMKKHGFKVRVDDQNPNNEYNREGASGGAFLIGHSLGTILIGHFLRNFPDSVAGTLSIDPISVLPYIPHLVRGFVYSEPKTTGEILVRIIAREIGVATVIQRHFNWFEFVIFPHLDQENTTNQPTSKTINKHQQQQQQRQGRHNSLLLKEPLRRKINQHFILSEKDVIVNYEQVSEYLITSKQPFTTLIDTPHGGFLLFHLLQVGRLTLDLLQLPVQPVPAPAPAPEEVEEKQTVLISDDCYVVPTTLLSSTTCIHPHFSFSSPILNPTRHRLVGRNRNPSCRTLNCHIHSVQSNDNLQLLLLNDVL